LHQPFNEDNVGYLADFLPIFFGAKMGCRNGRGVSGIAPVEDGDAGAIDKFVVGAVVDPEDASRCEDWRGAGSTTRESNFPGRRGRTGVLVASVQ